MPEPIGFFENEQTPKGQLKPRPKGRDFAKGSWYCSHMEKNDPHSPGFPPAVQVSVDAVVLSLIDGRLHALLVQRSAAPFQGRWALPGGFVHVEEDVDCLSSIRRVLKQKAALEVRHLEQLGTYSGADRDPRGWSVSVAYVAVVGPDASPVGPDARFFPVDDLPDLPFDHAHIANQAISRVRNKSSYSTLPALLLPKVFTLPQLQAVYEHVLGTPLNAAAFRRKVMAQGLIDPVNVSRKSKEAAAVGRPAQHYRLSRKVLTDLGRVVMLPDPRRGG